MANNVSYSVNFEDINTTSLFSDPSFQWAVDKQIKELSKQEVPCLFLAAQVFERTMNNLSFLPDCHIRYTGTPFNNVEHFIDGNIVEKFKDSFMSAFNKNRFEDEILIINSCTFENTVDKPFVFSIRCQFDGRLRVLSASAFPFFLTLMFEQGWNIQTNNLLKLYPVASQRDIQEDIGT